MGEVADGEVVEEEMPLDCLHPWILHIWLGLGYSFLPFFSFYISALPCMLLRCVAHEDRLFAKNRARRGGCPLNMQFEIDGKI